MKAFVREDRILLVIEVEKNCVKEKIDCLNIVTDQPYCKFSSPIFLGKSEVI